MLGGLGTITNAVNSLNSSNNTVDMTSHRRGKHQQRQFSGWRVGVAIGTGATIIILLVNVVSTIYITQNYYVIQPGIYTIIDSAPDSCSTAKKWDTWLHLLINIFGTSLLSASNYCMQCLSSPTRPEIDETHKKKRRLDIGIHSIRNLRYIKRKRLAIWSLLGVSSVPLHFLYNSIIFENFSANEYTVVVANNSFISGERWSMDALSDPYPNYYGVQTSLLSPLLHDFQRSLNGGINSSIQFDNLSNADCMRSYSNVMTVGRRNVLAMTKDLGQESLLNSSILTAQLYNPAEAPTSDPTRWICSFLTGFRYPCDVSRAIRQATTWSIDGFSIEYCLSEVVPEHCTLQFSLHIMVAVICCNILKLLCFLITIWIQEVDPLITMGDAVASFLDRLDPMTIGNCLLSRTSNSSENHLKLKSLPQQWQLRRKYWFMAPSSRQWVTCLILCVLMLSVASWLLSLSLESLTDNARPIDISSLWAMGIGNVDESNLLRGSAGSLNFIGTVLLANLPQATLSVAYYVYNGLYTSMLLTEEWTRFAYQRKALRVTAPMGQQRSTYFLQLPYRYAIPLATAFSLMHWLVSQTFFLARINVLDFTGALDVSSSLTTCGYSPIAIIFTIIAGGVLVLTVLLCGCVRQYRPRMPLGASCSMVISAACHALPEDEDASVLPVMWGIVSLRDDGVGHCAFTSKEVLPPAPGQLYA